MSQQEGIKKFQLSRVFFHALRTLDPKYLGRDLTFSFLPPNALKVSNWSGDKSECRIFQANLNKILESVSIMKLNQPEKKVQRIKGMRKWKKQFQIEGLSIIKVKKSYGNVYYLMGFTSQLNLYQVLMNLQDHSYKTFSTTFAKGLYKPAIQSLINCTDYQILVYDRLKITSTQLRFIQAQNKNQKKGKLIEILFELEKYAATKELVEKYKQLLRNQFFVCGLVLHKENAQNTKEIIIQRKPRAWKLVQTKEDEFACLWVICQSHQAQQRMNQILDECGWIKYIKFLKGLGKANEILQPLIQTFGNGILNQRQKFIEENFNVKGNSNQKSNEISLSLKQQDSYQKWKEALKYLV